MNTPPLLPADLYLASMLGLTEEEYRWFRAEVQSRVKVEPGVPQAGLETLAIIAIASAVISTGLTIAASFFKPNTQNTAGRAAQLRARNKLGDTIVSETRYAPVAGFDSVQEVSGLQSLIPLVYALRRSDCGGVRVNMPMLWSQMRSYGGSQLLRAIFMIGEGLIHEIDPYGFAIGNNTINGYDLGQYNSTSSRLSIYFRNNGGRFTSSNYLVGRVAASDPGAQSQSDIFSLPSGTDFCYVSKPSTQTVFGLYAPIGNNLGFKVNPSVRPKVVAQLTPDGDDGDAKVKCTIDNVVYAQRMKMQAFFSGRGYLIQPGTTEGATAVYRLTSTSDANTVFSRLTSTNLDWTYNVKQFQLFSQSNVNKPKDNGWRYVADEDDEGSLASRVSVANVTITVDNNLKKATVSGEIRFNPGGLKDNKFLDEPDPSLEQLRQSKFRVNILIPALSEDEEDEGDEIKVVFKPRIKVETRQDSKSKNTYTTITVGAGTSWASYTVLADTKLESQQDVKYVWKSTSKTTVYKNGQGEATLVVMPFSEKIKIDDIHFERCADVAAAIAGRQNSWDDALTIGELYKIGMAIGVCSSRTNNAFTSESANEPVGNGANVEAQFNIVRGGYNQAIAETDIMMSGSTWLTRQKDNTEPPRWTATQGPQLFRLAMADVSTARPCRIVELGLRSSLGITISGMINFKDTLTFDEADDRACRKRKGDIIKAGSLLKVDVFQSGTMTAREERYSCFWVWYRLGGTSQPFVRFPHTFGVRGSTLQDQFNYMRFTMPTTDHWEFRFEPLSGWEVRGGISDSVIYILDAKISSTVSLTANSVTLFFNGTSVPRNTATFCMSLGRVKESIGIPIPDRDGNTKSYIDAWGKLAETFIYEEIQSSAQSGPEHEIVYINEITPNSSTPNYDYIAMVGLNIRSAFEWQQFSQFSCYVKGGRVIRRLTSNAMNNQEPSSLFPEILYDVLTNDRFGVGESISEYQIDLPSFTTASEWCRDRRYYFDGVIAERRNVREWAADVAATMLLDLIQADGRFALAPAIVFGSAVPIRGLFTAGNIIEGSFEAEYLDEEDRLPVQVSVKWRQELESSGLVSKAIFPVEREVLVRETSTPETAPIESYDLTNYCTREGHAIDFACFLIRMRRLITHSIRFRTTPDGIMGGLAAGDYIRVALDITYYKEFANGVVLKDGTLVTTRPDVLGPGSHAVTAWNGTDSPVYDTTLTVTSGGTASPTGIVFTKKESGRSIKVFKVESIKIEDEGIIAIEAVEHPVDGNGISELGKNWTTYATDSNWVIRKN